MHKLGRLMDGETELDDKGLPKINPSNIDDFLTYYETLIKKRTKSDVKKVRDGLLKKIAKRNTADKNAERAKNLDRRIAEVRAFYEGDYNKMEQFQREFKDVKKDIKWYQWDLVMVIPNPDYNSHKKDVDNHYLDDVDDAIKRYQNCFKTIYRENQVEMRRERIQEVEMVRELIESRLKRDEKVLNKCGGRFVKTAKTDESRHRQEQVYEGGKEEEIPDESVHAQPINEMSFNESVDDGDVDPFLDTRDYCSDFSSMMLNAIIYRLNKVLGFETLLLMSKSGRDLYLLITASTGDLRTHAQNQDYRLTLEVGYTDLDSLPPFSLGKY